ncbi:hypothetical protein FRB99_006633 [Tulasnella sp. 403]|nr:hypothetical protein FRB99_006633 [Tulasnella sp. 403]
MPADRTTKPSKKSNKENGEQKPKRAPSAYNLFYKEQYPIWKANNPTASAKEAMGAIGALWADHPENPNRGKPKKERKPKKAKADEQSSSTVPSSDY